MDMINIRFEVNKQNEYGMELTGVAGEEPVGHVMMYYSYRGEHAAELGGIWLEDPEGGELYLPEFAEAFFEYLKKQGYTELWMSSECMEDGEPLGFRLEDRDTSGWYPKYIFRREL